MRRSPLRNNRAGTGFPGATRRQSSAFGKTFDDAALGELARSEKIGVDGVRRRR
jgi:hypothetical protein